MHSSGTAVRWTSSSSLAESNRLDLKTEIHRRIREQGKITFAEFMELALYWPEGGYYNNPDNIGAGGDFYTAPGAHPAFAALLCMQMFQMWTLLDRPQTFWIVEMGAGSGLLCHDLVSYSDHFPVEFRDSLHYLCLDRLVTPGLEGSLSPDFRSKVQRLSASGIPLRGIEGCFLSNELVDSLPVHQVRVKDGKLSEVYVTVADGGLAEVLGPPSRPALKERLDSLGLVLPEGCTAEINLEVNPWMQEVSRAMRRGFLLTIDYGHPARDLYSVQRSRGTLTCYYKHTQTDEPYRRLGEQDISAHVDFTSLAEVGKRHSLECVGFGTQQEFLQNLGIQRFMTRLRSSGLKQREADANRMGMLDLVRPEGIGGFKVLCQGKGVGTPTLWGFAPLDLIEAELGELPVPLLKPHHMPLLEGRYPGTHFEWEEAWPRGERV